MVGASAVGVDPAQGGKRDKILLLRWKNDIPTMASGAGLNSNISGTAN
jgi:hypothetical protein